MESYIWSIWLTFPDPRNQGVLIAPFGPGVYQVRNKNTGEFVLFGKGKNLAYRMTSLLPYPHGQGVRKNLDKREYILNNIENIEYRTMALKNFADLTEIEREVKNLELYKYYT